MSDNVFGEPAASGADLNPDAGLPNVMDLVAQLATLVQGRFVEVLLAGLIPGFALLGGVVLTVVGTYAIVFAAMLPGIAANDDSLVGIGALGGALTATFGFTGGLVLVTTPMWASLYRATWAHLVRGEPLGLMSPLSTFTQDLFSVYAYTFVTGALVLTGAMFCYVPGILLQGMLVFAWPALVIHRLSIGAAIRWSFEHTLAHPAWHMALWAVGFVMALVLPYVPVIGYALLFSIHTLFVVLAYRAVAGDGETIRPAT